MNPLSPHAGRERGIIPHTTPFALSLSTPFALSLSTPFALSLPTPFALSLPTPFALSLSKGPLAHAKIAQACPAPIKSAAPPRSP